MLRGALETPWPYSLRMGEGLVELEEGGDAVGFGHFQVEAVGRHDGAVVGAVGREKVGGHGQGVVEVREGGVGVRRAGVEDGAGRGFDFLARRRGGAEVGPWEVVVDDVGGIAVAHFKAPANGAHPGHVDVGDEDAEVIEGSGRNETCQVAGNCSGRKETHWNITTTL